MGVRPLGAHLDVEVGMGTRGRGRPRLQHPVLRRLVLERPRRRHRRNGRRHLPRVAGLEWLAERLARRLAGQPAAAQPSWLELLRTCRRRHRPSQRQGNGPRASSGHRVDLDPNLSRQGTRKKRRPQCTAPKPATGACLPPARRTKVGRRPAPSVAEFLQPQPQPPTKGSPPSG